VAFPPSVLAAALYHPAFFPMDIVKHHLLKNSSKKLRKFFNLENIFF
jgi:hypothetical protein